MNRKLPILVFALLAFSVPAGAERNEAVLLGIAARFDPVPWAGNRFSTAVISAPGWLGMLDRPEVLYGQVTSEGPFDKDNLLCVRSRGFGFATESFHWGDSLETRRYMVAVGHRLGANAAVAIAYSWFGSDDPDLDALTSWDAGFAYRLGWRLEASLTGRNLLRTGFGGFELGRFYEAGLRATVIDRKLTLFGQGRHYRGDDFDEIVPVFGAEFFPMNYLTLRARADTDGNQGLDIEIVFETASVGFHYRFVDGAEDGSLAYVKLHVPRGR